MRYIINYHRVSDSFIELFSHSHKLLLLKSDQIHLRTFPLPIWKVHVCQYRTLMDVENQFSWQCSLITVTLFYMVKSAYRFHHMIWSISRDIWTHHCRGSHEPAAGVKNHRGTGAEGGGRVCSRALPAGETPQKGHWMKQNLIK